MLFTLMILFPLRLPKNKFPRLPVAAFLFCLAIGSPPMLSPENNNAPQVKIFYFDKDLQRIDFLVSFVS